MKYDQELIFQIIPMPLECSSSTSLQELTGMSATCRLKEWQNVDEWHFCNIALSGMVNQCININIFINASLYMMIGNALKGSFVGLAGLAVEGACTITEWHGEADTIILQKASKLDRFNTFTFINSMEPILWKESVHSSLIAGYQTSILFEYQLKSIKNCQEI